MSRSLLIGLLLRLYPPAWRARYGEELEGLIAESSGGGRVPWRTRADVALAAGRERLRAAGLSGDGASPGDQVRSGSLLVLCAWTVCMVAGAVVQKFSEHWQDVTPMADRSLPAVAFDGLLAAAGVGSVLVLAGIAAALPSLLLFLRAGGWPAIRRRVLAAVLMSAVALAVTVALVAWAHALTSRQREGNEVGYGILFVLWAGLVIGCLATWTAAAVAAARRLELPVGTLRLEAWLAAAVTAVMGLMTVATAIWWAELAYAAPWFLAGKPRGAPASPLAPTLLGAAILMLVATLLGAVGASRALRSAPALFLPR